MLSFLLLIVGSTILHLPQQVFSSSSSSSSSSTTFSRTGSIVNRSIHSTKETKLPLKYESSQQTTTLDYFNFIRFDIDTDNNSNNNHHPNNHHTFRGGSSEESINDDEDAINMDDTSSSTTISSTSTKDVISDHDTPTTESLTLDDDDDDNDGTITVNDSDSSNEVESLSSISTTSSTLLETSSTTLSPEVSTTDTPLVSTTSISTSTGALTKKEKKLAKRKERLDRKNHVTRHAKNLKNRNHLNISRKLVHAGFGTFFAILNHCLPRENFVSLMTYVTSVTLLMEMARYRKGFGWINDTLHFILGKSLRKHEMEGKFTGSFYYFAGVTITAALFPKSSATLGIMQLALADPSASFFGMQTRHVYWSRIENGFFGLGRNKGLLGFLGGAVFCFPFNYRALSLATTSSPHSGTVGVATSARSLLGGRSSIAQASIALGLAGAFSDLCVPSPALMMPRKILGIPMPPFHVDDNVVVPIFSGYACTKIFAALGWLAAGKVDLSKFIMF